MGIQGLLPLLSSIQKYSHLRDFAGQKLGIDAYGWLHRGTFTCANELAQGKPTRGYVDFALSRVRMLQHFGVTPYLVFDGGRLPSKAQTEQGRSERRKEGRRKGLALLEAGKTTLAYQELQKSIDVTPQMARNLIEELKIAGIEFIVAPYEADSQLAYLEKKGVISGILSEDSDLLVFGAQVLITKLDQYGECVVYQRSDFTKCKEVSLVNWSDTEFRMMTILSGCDYLAGIPGVGLKSAYRLVRQHKSIDKVVRMLQFDGKKKVPVNYLDLFHNAERTFLYQWVYCPEALRLVNLNAVPTGMSSADMPYIGVEVDNLLATGVANGTLHPGTKEPLKSTLLPALGRRKQASLQQTPDLKPGRPISEFFRPVRTPLAELEPNSFTPSPSQQRLLDSQQSRSWSARSTPSGRRDDTTGLRAAILGSSAQSARKIGVKQPLKKARLCADNAGETTDNAKHDVQAVASPYFAKPTLSSKNRKAATAFELFSDDSICEGLESTAKVAEQSYLSSQKAQTEQSPKKRKHFEVLRDDGEKPWSRADMPSTQSLSFSSTLRSQSSFVTTTTMSSLSGNSLNDSQHETQEDSVDTGKQPNDWLHALKVPAKRSLTGRATAGTCRQYEQDIGHGDEASSTYGEAEVLCSSPPRSPEFEGSDHNPEDIDGAAMERRHSTSREQEDEHKLLGSEDSLVPQSPDDGRLRPKLNLGHFLFAR